MDYKNQVIDGTIGDERELELVRESIRLELEKQKILGYPVVYRDSKTGDIVQRFPDGKIENLQEDMAHG